MKEEKTSENIDLLFKNFLGGFDSVRHEYVINLANGQNTPSPWVNIITNPVFGSMISSSGSGFSWFKNSYLFRLTPWISDPVTEKGGELLFLKDEGTGEVWSPTPLPIREPSSYRIRHGQGYSIFEHQSHGISQRLTVFVAKDRPIKFLSLKLSNETNMNRLLSAVFFVQWVLGDFAENTRSNLLVNVDFSKDLILARNPFLPGFENEAAFVGSLSSESNFCIDRTEFFGRENGLIPEGLLKPVLSNNTSIPNDPAGAVQTFIELPARSVREVVFYLGQSKFEEITQTVRQFKKKENAKDTLSAVDKRWHNLLTKFQIKTPSQSLNVLFNDWLIYQLLNSRFWGRTGLYQPSGAYGFRDQLQDSLALIWLDYKMTRRHIVLAASRQFDTGDVQHWWHFPQGAGIRSESSDAALWLVYAVINYLKVTQDKTILEEKIPFLSTDNPAHKPGAYFVPTVKRLPVTLYGHCTAALEKSISLFGSHGLPLFQKGDWNDGYNNVGPKGKGESVWLALFLSSILKDFADVCKTRGDYKRAENYQKISREQISIVEKESWDGEWFARGFFDDGGVLGSHKNLEGRIDSVAQSWSVIGGGVDIDKAKIAMESVKRLLIDEQNKLILLFDPPFDKTSPAPGYIQSYPPGVRENGGCYVHAALWVSWAYALLGDGDSAVSLLDMVNPFNRSSGSFESMKYAVEPYVLAADIYSKPPHTGKGGWTWYTGSAGVYYRLVLGVILGLDFRGSTLRFNPCLPKSWPECEAEFRFGQASYKVIIKNPFHTNQGVEKVFLNGAIVPDGIIKLANTSGVHEITVVLGR